MRSNSNTRLWEIDTLRGIAIVEMVFFHFMWDLSFFGLYHGNILAPPWQFFARSIATTFIFVMGVSLTLSYEQAKNREGEGPHYPKFLGRGAKIFGWGMLITIGTYFFFGSVVVIFGILHLLGAAIVLAYPFLERRWLSLGAGLGLIALGIYLNTIIVDYPWLTWFGIRQGGRHMVDYYPLLPWAGIALVGVFVGHTFYANRQRQFPLPDLSDLPFIQGLKKLGRHSLLIYLIHQPILLGILTLVSLGVT